MDIIGYGKLRFKKVGDKLYWTTSLNVGDKEKSLWQTFPTSFKKELEEKIKKEFKSRTFKSDDKYIDIHIEKGFISGYVDKNNKVVTKFVVTELTFPKPTKKETSVELDF